MKMTTLNQHENNYKCPNCKHPIQLSNADFIKGVAMVSCVDCGRDAFTIEETMLAAN